jgi:hypothetical protein
MKPGEQVISHAYVYGGFEEKTGDVRDIVKYESLVDLVKELKRWSGGRVAVVPESSCEAVALKQMLEKEAPNLRAQLLYLPQLYSEAAQGYSKNVRELATVKHSKLGEAYKCEAEGYSATLLREWSSEELEELRKAKETILELSPDRLGLKDYLAEAAGKMLIALAAAPFGAAVALAVDRLLGALASLNLQGAAQALLAKVGGVSVKQAEGLASRVLEGWSRPEARNTVAEGLAKLVVAAREAAPHLDREELETVVDQAALEWGMDAHTFKTIVKNLAKMASEELATRKDLEEFLRQRIGEELAKVERELRVVEAVAGVHFVPETLGVQFDEKGILLRNVLAREKARYIPSPQEGKLREAFEAVRGGGVVVVRGKKGEGKSSLAKAFLAKLMICEPAAVIELRDTTVDIDSLKSAVDRIGEAGRTPVLYYDPSKTGAYPAGAPWSGEYMPASALPQVNIVASLVKRVVVDKHVPAVIVLSDDLYDLVKEQLRSGEGLKVAEVEVSLENEAGFLAGLVEEYSAEEGVGCEPGVVEQVAKDASRYGANRAVVAVLAADWLRRSKCNPTVVEEALERAGGRAEEFVLDYIWYAVLDADRETANTFAPLILLTAIFGPIPQGLGEELLIALGASEDKVSGSGVVKWFSQPLHGTVLEALLRLARLATGEETMSARSDLVDAVRLALNKVKRLPLVNVGSILEGKLEELLPSLEKRQPGRWRRLALIAGSALTAHSEAPLVAAEMNRLPGDALKPCKLDSYLLVGGVIPPLIIGVALRSPHALARPLACCYKEAAEEIEKLEETWRERGAYPIERLYALGLALSVAEAKGLGEEVEVWEAEAALNVAAATVQRVSRAECAAAVLKAFKPLGELAPHYHVKLASAASELSELDEDAVREIAGAVDGALQNHGEELEERAWLLVEAVHVYSNLLAKHAKYFREEDWELMRGRMCELLEKLEGQLRVIAEAFALRAALRRGLEPCGGGGAASKAVELLEKLEGMEGEEPSGQAVEWAEEQVFKPEEFKLVVKDVRGALAYALAKYMRNNDDLEAAEELFESSAALCRELENWENYLAARSLAARCSVLKAGSLEELKERAKISGSLWSEAKGRERAIVSLMYLEKEAFVLAEYLVSLALEGRGDEVSKLLDEEGLLLGRFPDVGVAVRLLLERLGVEVEKPKAQEIAEALRNDIEQVFRPAFNLLMGLPEDAPDECSEIEDEESARTCRTAVEAVRGDGKAAGTLKTSFLELLDKIVGDGLKGLTQGFMEREAAERFHRELQAFVEERDTGDVVQLYAPETSLASFVLMLWALSNDDEELARAHAKRASIFYKGKLLRRLFREAAEAQGERFELALLKLFYYHI